MRAIAALAAAVAMLVVAPAAHAVLPVSGVTIANGNGTVGVSWTNPGDPAQTHTRIYRKTTLDGAWTLVHTEPVAGATTWTDNTVANGSSYWYAVRSYDSLATAEMPVLTTGGLRGTYFDNNDYTGYVGTSTNPTININWGSGKPAQMTGVDDWSIKWRGWILADYNETYTIYSTSDNNQAVRIDGSAVVSSVCCAETSGTVALSPGWHEIESDYIDYTGNANVALSWQSTSVPKAIVPSTHLAHESEHLATPSDVVLDVTAPDGAEYIDSGSTTITWTKAGAVAVDRFVLDYSTDGGTSWGNTISNGVVGTATNYSWNLPFGWSNDQMRVRIRAYSATQGLLATSTSAGNFEIDTLGAPGVTNVRAVPGNSQVVLTWDNPGDPDFDHVVIFRSTQEGALGAPLPGGTTAPGQETFTDLTASNGIDYWYTLRSVDVNGTTGPTIGQGGQFAYSMYGDTAWSSHRLARSWTSVMSEWIGESGYDCETGTAYPGGYVCGNSRRRWWGMFYAPTTGSYTIYLDRYSYGRAWVDDTLLVDAWTDCNCEASGAVTLTKGWHRLRVDHGSVANWSEMYVYWAGPGIAKDYIPTSHMATEPEAHAQPQAATVTLNSPTGGETLLGDQQVEFDWTTVGTGGSAVQIDYSNDGGTSWHGIKTSLPTTGTLHWSIPPSLNTAQLRFRATLLGASRQPSVFDETGNITIDTTTAGPPPVTNVAAIAGDGSVTVTWDDPVPTGSFDHAIVYRSTKENELGTAISTAPGHVAAGVETFTDNTAVNGTAYYYRVRAADAAGRITRNFVAGRLRRSTWRGDTDLVEYRFHESDTTPIDDWWGANGYDSYYNQLWPGAQIDNRFGTRWTGGLYIPTTGTYLFDNRDSNDGARFWLDGVKYGDNWPLGHNTSNYYAGGLFLTQGWHDLSLEWFDASDWSQIRFIWTGPGIGRAVVPAANFGEEPVAMATPNDAGIALDSPNGGEAYHDGERMEVAWTVTGTAGHNVDVSYSTNSGATWARVVEVWIPVATGSFSWTIPSELASTNTRVRIRLRDSTGRILDEDVSDADFTIDSTPSGPPPITNVQAVAGDGSVTVTWDDPSPAGSFDHAIVYRSTKENELGTPVSSGPGHVAAGVETFTDSAAVNGTAYYYRVRAADAAGRITRNFVAGRLRRSTWRGDTDLVEYRFHESDTTPIDDWWGSSGYDGYHNPLWPGAQIDNRFGTRWTGGLYIPTTGTYIFDNRDSNDGSRFWIDGIKFGDSWPLGHNGSNYYASGIQLNQGWHDLSLEWFDASDWSQIRFLWSGPGIGRAVVPAASFGEEPVAMATPSDATIALDSPNGGETYHEGDRMDVAWTATGTAGHNVDVSYSTNSGATWDRVVEVWIPVATNSFSWTIPSNVSSTTTRVRVRLRDSTGRILDEDVSDADFAIDASAGPPPITNVRAVPGNGSVTVTWDDPAVTGAFDHAVVYRSTEENLLGDVVSTGPGHVAAGVEQFVDGTAVNGTTYYYRVRAADAAGRITRNFVAGRLRRSVWAGPTDLDTFRFVDSDTSVIDDWGGNAGYDQFHHNLWPGTFFYNDYGMRWTGGLYIPTTGTYVFDNRDSNDGARLWLDGMKLADNWPLGHNGSNFYVSGMYLTQGWHDLSLEWFDDSDWSQIRFLWTGPGIARAVVPVSNLGEEPVGMATPANTSITLNSPVGGETYRSGSQMHIDWTSPGGAATSVFLSYSMDGGDTWAHSIAHSLSLVDSRDWLVPPSLTTSQFRIRAEARDVNGQVVAIDESGNITIDTTTAGPPPITNLRAVGGNNQTTLSWTNPGGSFHHAVIYRSTDENLVGDVIHTTSDSGVNSWVDSTAVNGVTYHYRVNAADIVGTETINIASGQIRESHYFDYNPFGAFRWTDTSTSMQIPNYGVNLGPYSKEDPGGEADWSGHSVRKTGYLYVPTSGTYMIDTRDSDDGNAIYIDGVRRGSTWQNCDCGANLYAGGMYLTQGWHPISIEAGDYDYQGSDLYLRWQGPGIARQDVPTANLGRDMVATVTPSTTLISITSPSGGESWGGMSEDVTWTAANLPAFHRVKASLSLDGGSNWRVLTVDVGASPWNWYLPRNTNTSTARMRLEVIDTATGRSVAQSESPAFSIDTATLQPVSNVQVDSDWTEVHLTWTDPADAKFDHVNVYRSTSQFVLGTKIDTVAKGTQAYTDASLTNGTTYWYTLRAAEVDDDEAVRLQAGGLAGSYYDGLNFDTLKGRQLDASLNMDWGTARPPLTTTNDNHSAEWVGYYNIASSGVTDLDVYSSQMMMSVDIGNASILDQRGVDCNGCIRTAFNAAEFTAGWYPIRVTGQDLSFGSSVFLRHKPPSGTRAIIGSGNFAVEGQVSGTPLDDTPPYPSPSGQVTVNSPTQITWAAPGAGDDESGLAPSAFSFNNGTDWQVSDTFVLSDLTANTQYQQTVVVRDNFGLTTTPRTLTARTHALNPNVTADKSTGSWLGPGAVTITFSNNAVWGPGGVEYYRYVFNTSPTHAFTGTETQWNAGTLPLIPPSSGVYYLHARSYNADGVGAGTVDVGPFWVDVTAPTPNPPTVGHTSTASNVVFDVDPISDPHSGVAASAYSFDDGGTWQASDTWDTGAIGTNQPATVTVKVRDAIGNVSTGVTETAYTAPAAPDVTPSPAPDATWRASGSVVTMTNDIGFGPGAVAGYRVKVSTLANDSPTTADTNWTSGTLPVPIVGTSANFYIHVRSYNGSNDFGTTQSFGPYKVDGSGPGATLPVADEDPTNTDPVLTWTGVVDSESGLAGYRVYRSTTGTVLGSQVADQAGTSYTDAGPLVDGTRYYYTVQAYDQLNNEQSIGNTQIGVTYDTVSPIGTTISIDGGAGHTASTTVALTLNSTNADEMRIGNLPDLSDGSWEPYATSSGWTITGGGDGIKTVYVRYRNSNGTESGTVSDTIFLDQTAPSPDPATGSATPLGATEISWASNAASDAGVGLHAQPYSFDGGSTWQAASSLTENTLTPNTPYTRTIVLRDALGNESAGGVVQGSTQPVAPSISSNPAPDAINTQPLGETITFTNDAGWGAGAVEYYRWAWTNVATHTFDGSEAVWSAGTFTRREWTTSTWYLHVRAYNGDDAPGQQSTIGPFMFAPPTGSQTLYSNVGSSQTLDCTKTDFTTTLLPGLADDATVDCDVTSDGDWNLKVKAAAAAPFFTGFLDYTTVPEAYQAPAAADAHVAFTASGAQSHSDFSGGTLWRGFVGTTDITIGGDAVATAGTETISTSVRAALGASSTVAAGARSQTLTYTLSPGAP